jgi:hypothetical protein
MSAVTKIYDGNTSVAALPASTFGNYVNGDNANLSLSGGSGSYDTRHVGNGKTVSYSALVLGGSAAGNYILSGTAASGSGSITPLASITWTGGGGNSNWSNAANWGGTSVDGSNVLNVNLAGAGVTYDAASGSTSVASISNIGGLAVSGGILGISGAISMPSYAQTGGTLNGAGSLAVTSNFSKSGGTIALSGPISITQSSGNLVFGNDAPLMLGAINTTSGNIDIDTTGGIFTSAAPIVANAGAISLIAHSPISIGSGGLNATGGITLNALTPGGGSTITLDGAVVAGGVVSVAAYGAVNQNAGIQGQSISVGSSSGNIIVASGAVSSVPAGGSISYSAIAGSITSTTGNFSGATPVFIESAGVVATGSTTTTNDIAVVVAKTTSALAEENVIAPEAQPPLAEASGSISLLASVSHTTGGEAGTFGAVSEPIVGASGTDSNRTPGTSPAGETPGAEQVSAKEENKKDAGTETEGKKESGSREPKKQDARPAVKKLAQCS